MTGCSLILSIYLASSESSRAQTVSADIMIRDGAVAGSAQDFTVAFEPEATYVAWRDTRNNATTGADIYIQKISSDGTPLWAVNGLAVCTAEEDQQLPAIVPDGAGGALVAWLDDRGGNVDSIAAQRIAPSGTVQWGVNGVFVGVVISEQPRPFAHHAADGGFVVTWWDAEPVFNPDDHMLTLLAQKLDADGNLLWDIGGPEPGDVWGPGIEVINGILRGRSVPDGAGGVVAFGKLQNNRGFRFQRVASDQSAVWTAQVDYEADLVDSVPFNFASDGVGGVVLVYRVGSTLRGVRVGVDGTLAWGANGIDILTSNLNTAQNFAVTGDGQGGAFVAWIASSPRDVRVQHFSANGTAQWTAGGAVVPDLSSSETDPAILADGHGGIFISFDTASSVRGQRLDSTGAAEWFDGGNNGLNLGVGNLPVIGPRVTGPVVVYSRGFGLFARIIEVTTPTVLQLSGVQIAPGSVSMTLNGGVEGTVYNILRTTMLSDSPSWILVGTIQRGASWVDEDPPSNSAFYMVSEPTP